MRDLKLHLISLSSVNPLSFADKSVDDEEYEKEQNAANLVYILGEDLKTFSLVQEMSGKKLKHARLHDHEVGLRFGLRDPPLSFLRCSTSRTSSYNKPYSKEGRMKEDRRPLFPKATLKAKCATWLLKQNLVFSHF